MLKIIIDKVSGRDPKTQITIKAQGNRRLKIRDLQSNSVISNISIADKAELT